ncbi:hypothetical protein GIB67_015872 [Kingdonia uniflora]|uniref:Phosphoribulokinase/uridine kinase domain-containing protein n=1 Tax=Kingdonia uniflora TaxID=39325 RepID=A0A7J7NGM0_9MAGN|nr:hypothetical protein GIB67_015872 [Kingdonia uniflora]
MPPDNSGAESPRRKLGLLRDQVQLVKRKDCNRYEIVPIQDPLSFEKGFFIVIRACQLLAQKNDGIILVGVAGPSGAGKTVFTEKVLNFMPSIAVISMDNYNDASRIIDGNFDDPRLTDYDTLLENIHGLKEGKPVEVPIYDFKSSCRTGFRDLTREAFQMFENSNVRKDGVLTSVGIKIDIDDLKINHHDIPTEIEVPCATDFVGGVGEDALEIEAGVVTEESKKFDEDETLRRDDGEKGSLCD